jgi:hypothetical protein
MIPADDGAVATMWILASILRHRCSHRINCWCICCSQRSLHPLASQLLVTQRCARSDD